jgi:hypothetical protein
MHPTAQFCFPQWRAPQAGVALVGARQHYVSVGVAPEGGGVVPTWPVSGGPAPVLVVDPTLTVPASQPVVAAAAHCPWTTPAAPPCVTAAGLAAGQVVPLGVPPQWLTWYLQGPGRPL